jgi:hypothetical protein
MLNFISHDALSVVVSFLDLKSSTRLGTVGTSVSPWGWHRKTLNFTQKQFAHFTSSGRVTSWTSPPTGSMRNECEITMELKGVTTVRVQDICLPFLTNWERPRVIEKWQKVLMRCPNLTSLAYCRENPPTVPSAAAHRSPSLGLAPMVIPKLSLGQLKSLQITGHACDLCSCFPTDLKTLSAIPPLAEICVTIAPAAGLNPQLLVDAFQVLLETHSGTLEVLHLSNNTQRCRKYKLLDAQSPVLIPFKPWIARGTRVLVFQRLAIQSHMLVEALTKGGARSLEVLIVTKRRPWRRNQTTPMSHCNQLELIQTNPMLQCLILQDQPPPDSKCQNAMDQHTPHLALAHWSYAVLDRIRSLTLGIPTRQRLTDEWTTKTLLMILKNTIAPRLNPYIPSGLRKPVWARPLALTRMG